MSTFAIQCFLDGERKLTNELTAEEAHNFRKAAQHLTDYLTTVYKLDGDNALPKLPTDKIGENMNTK